MEMPRDRRAARRVGKNAAARLAAQLGSRLLSLVLVALVARYEGATGLGRYALIVTTLGIVGAAADLGLNMYLTRAVARLDDRQRERDALSGVLPIKLALSLAATLLVWGAALAGPWPEPTRQALWMGSLLLLPDQIQGGLRAFVNGRQRMKISALVDVCVRALGLAGSLAALAGGWGVSGVLGVAAGASAIGVLMYGGALWRWGDLAALRLATADWRAILGASYPFALTGIIAVAYSRVGLLLLGAWQGEAAAGWYSAAYKLWEAVGLLPGNLLEALFPELARLGASEGGAHRLRRLFRTGAWAMLAAGLALALGGIALAGLLVRLVYGAGPDDAPTVLLFRVLICAAPALFVYLLAGHTLYALERQRRVTMAMLAVGLLSLGVNALAIPRWGQVGAAGAAALSEWALAGLLVAQARRALRASTGGAADEQG